MIRPAPVARPDLLRDRPGGGDNLVAVERHWPTTLDQDTATHDHGIDLGVETAVHQDAEPVDYR